MKGTDEHNNTLKKMIQQYIDKAYYKNYLQGFINWLGTDKNINTKYQYVKICNRFLEYTDPFDIKTLNVDDYMNFFSLFDDKSNSYRIVIYSALSNFSEYMHTTNKCYDNPMSKVKRPKQIESQETVEKREHGFLSKEEIKQFLSNVKIGVGTDYAKSRQAKWRIRDEFIMIFMLSTGIRVGALTKIDINDIKYDEDNCYIVTTEKRGKVRKFYLTDDVRILLEEYLELRSECLNGKEEDALFISDRKKRMTTASISKLVSKYSESFKKISPHKLRATFGTQLYKETHDIYFVQQSMGHSSPQTTGLYIRGEEESIQKESTEMMNSLIFGEK